MDAAPCEIAAQALPAAASGALSPHCLSFDQATEGWALEKRGMAAQAGLDWGRSAGAPEPQHATVGLRFSSAANLAASADARLTI
jgi:hypothetical protein